MKNLKFTSHNPKECKEKDSKNKDQNKEMLTLFHKALEEENHLLIYLTMGHHLSTIKNKEFKKMKFIQKRSKTIILIINKTM